MKFSVLVAPSRSACACAIVCCLLLWGCASERSAERPAQLPPIVRAPVDSLPPAPLPARTTWVETTLRRMTLEEKAAQMVCVFTFSHYYASDNDRWKELERLVTKRKIGGFVFSEGPLYAYPVYANKLQKLSDVPLLISTDFERGPGMRVDEATMLPRAMAIGATRDTRLAYEAGRVTPKAAPLASSKTMRLSPT
jgi:Glycosyl hydrolase family 3 N terminal domain